MDRVLGAVVLPSLLLLAASVDWNLISFINLLAFIFVQSTSRKRGYHIWLRPFVLWFIIIFSLLAILVQVVFNIVWFLNGNESTSTDNKWAQLIGFVRVQAWETTPIVYFITTQLAACFTAYVNIHARLLQYQYTLWRNLSTAVDYFEPHLKVTCCLLLPAIQVVVGISHSSWIFLPFFVSSCVGLVDWSLTSNFLGLFRWWRPLSMYACFNIIILYLYQLPIEFPKIIVTFSNFIGLYKISSSSEWPELTSGISLIVFYFMLSSVKCDLKDMDDVMSEQHTSLTEQLVPSNHSFFLRESRFGIMHRNVLLNGGCANSQIGGCANRNRGSAAGINRLRTPDAGTVVSSGIVGEIANRVVVGRNCRRKKRNSVAS